MIGYENIMALHFFLSLLTRHLDYILFAPRPHPLQPSVEEMWR